MSKKHKKVVTQAEAKVEKKVETKVEKTEKKETHADNLINTKTLAAMCGVTPKALRRRLRAKWYNDGVHTNYGWVPGDPILNEILTSYGKKPIEAKA